MMVMGFGCNVVVIMLICIIELFCECMMVILINNFVLCNGRWFMLILLVFLFMVIGFIGSVKIFVMVFVVVGIVLFGIVVMLFVLWVLFKMVLCGVLIYYMLEFLFYCKLKFVDIIVCVMFDKLLFVLKCVIIVVVFVVVLMWVLVNIYIGDMSILMYFV